jgi:methyl-accepting chemotaxis protein
MQIRMMFRIEQYSKESLKNQIHELAEESNLGFIDAIYKVASMRDLAESIFDADEYRQDTENYFYNTVRPLMDGFVHNIIDKSLFVTAAYFVVHPDFADSPYVFDIYFEETAAGIITTDDVAVDLQSVVDYEAQDWFYGAFHSGQPHWTQIFTWNNGVIMVSYGEPVIINGEKVGIVGVDMAINGIEKIVSEVTLFDTGFALLEDNYDEFLPTNDFIRQLSSQDKARLIEASHDSGSDGSDDGVFEIKFDDINYVVAHDHLINDYDFFLMVPKSEFNAEARAAMVRLLIGFLIVFPIFLIVSYFIGRYISKPMARVAQTVDTMSNSLADESMQLSSNSIALADGCSEQMEVVSALNGMMGKITQNTDDNVKMLGQAVDSVKGVSQDAKDGEQNIMQLAAAVNDISGAVNGINDVLQAIEEIASQTGILALNAAVESANAGIYGAGFAVVTNEVRDLAAKSSEAAQECAKLIEISTKKAAIGERLAKVTTESFVKIAEGVTNGDKIISQIAVNSQKNNDDVASMNEKLEIVLSVTRKTAANTQELTAMSEELSSQADLLKEQASMF